MQNLILEYESYNRQAYQENKDKEHEAAEENQKTMTEYTAQIDLIEIRLKEHLRSEMKFCGKNKQLEEITTIEMILTSPKLRQWKINFK